MSKVKGKLKKAKVQRQKAQVIRSQLLIKSVCRLPLAFDLFTFAFLRSTSAFAYRPLN
jgi:hypothetical protein